MSSSFTLGDGDGPRPTPPPSGDPQLPAPCLLVEPGRAGAATGAPRMIDHNAVWDILVDECRAREDMRSEFVHIWPECREFRFQGTLGFGGKVWWNGDLAYVTCYSDDASDQRKRVIKATNDRLAEYCDSCERSTP